MNTLRFIAASIVGAGAVAYGFHLLWVHALMPFGRGFVRLIRGLMSLNVFLDAVPTLVDIAQEFKPNGGESLRDQIDMLNLVASDIQSQLEPLVLASLWDGETERREGGNS